MFQFADSSRHKILRVLTYHPRGFDLSVLSESISSKRRSRANIVHFNPPSTFATLGDLNAFPIELLNEILRYSDLYTISMFSLLNRQARTIVHASLPYKHLLRHAPRALVALIRTGASHFTMDKVFQAFCSPSSLRQLWSISLDPGVYPVLFLMFADGSRTHANGRKPSKGGIWAHQEVTCKSPHCDHLTRYLRSFPQSLHNATSSSQPSERSSSGDHDSRWGARSCKVHGIVENVSWRGYFRTTHSDG